MIHCPVCTSTKVETWSEARDYEYESTDKTYTYYHCPPCGTIFIHPVPLDELQTIYPSNYYSFVEGKKNLVTGLKETLDKRYFKKLLSRLQGSSLSVLDVGGGTGWLSTMLRNTDSRVKHTAIVDIDAAAKEKAEAAGHYYFEGRLEEFETEQQYDLILMLNLIEHVADPLAVLQQASRLLSSGGILLIKTPNINSFDARLFRGSYWGGLHAPRHWVIFSEKSLRLLLKQTPLKVRRLQYTQGGPFWAFSIIAALAKKGWLRADQQRPIIFHPLFPLFAAMGAAFDFLRRPFAPTSQVFVELERK